MISQLLRKNSSFFLTKNNFFSGLVLASLFLLSCKSVPVSSPSAEADFSKHLYKRYEVSGEKFFSADLDLRINNGDTKNVKGKIYIRRDEYIFANINFLGIELGRIELSVDSIKLINRIEKKFFFGSIEDLNYKFNIDLSYYQIESIFLKGIVFDKKENRKKFKNRIQENEQFYFFVYQNLNGIKVKSVFDRSSFEQKGIEILDGHSSFYLEGSFSNYYADGSYPKNIRIDLKSDDFNAEIDVTVGKISNSKILSRSFVVNNKYREIIF